MCASRLIANMSFFTVRVAKAFPTIGKRRTHLRERSIVRYALTMRRTSYAPLNGRGGVTAHFQNDAASVVHDRLWRDAELPEFTAHF
jgi:hypothetical protein